MKKISFIVLIMALFLGACSQQPISSSDGQQFPIPPGEPNVTDEPAPVGVDISSMSSYQPVRVVDVNVEVGVGSPIPVFVDVGADLPDICAQVEYVEVVQDGDTFKVQIGTVLSTEQDCLRDTYPFRMKIPLSVVDLPAGSYFVDVNGVRGDFKLEAGSSAADLLSADTPLVKRDVQVDDVSIEVGLGSPLPVHAVVSANLPSACSQLGEIQMHKDGNTFNVRLTASMPAETDCSPDPLPMRVEIPLNLFLLPEGTFEVIVNGATANFTIPMN